MRVMLIPKVVGGLGMILKVLEKIDWRYWKSEEELRLPKQQYYDRLHYSEVTWRPE